MSKVIRHDVGKLKAKAARHYEGAGIIATTATTAQTIFLFASLVTFVGNTSMPYGILLTHYITGVIMLIAFVVYVVGRGGLVEGEFSVRATQAYNKLSNVNRPLAKPIVDKIYELESSGDQESREMQNVLLRRLDLIEKMVESETHQRVTNAVEDKSDTYAAFEWLKMYPAPPALESKSKSNRTLNNEVFQTTPINDLDTVPDRMIWR